MRTTGDGLFQDLTQPRQGKISDPMELLLLQAIAAAPDAVVAGAPKIPQMTDDAQDHDQCGWAAVLTAAAALGPSPRHDL
jgi:hypothetical protein